MRKKSTKSRLGISYNVQPFFLVIWYFYSYKINDLSNIKSKIISVISLILIFQRNMV